MKSTKQVKTNLRLNRQWLKRVFFTVLEWGLLALVITGLTGCTLLNIGGNPPPPTAAPPVVTVPGVEPSPVAPQPSLPSAPTYTPQPIFTEQPTYTPLPTYTPFPTYTPVPTFTTAPVYVAPSPVPPTPYTGACCTLRVRNAGKVTYWIGAALPYGGAYIEPRHYVEFYPHKPTWMRIWWCRYSKYYDDWDDDWWWDDNPWNNRHLYNCRHTDVYVDKTLEEISVR